ncbi:ABC transporter permease [Streptomyces sp. NBC_00237]|nr:ABC transporter permease [Streptomyces sp. NBC_00237]
MGAKFAVSGGREGWTRTILTAVGVGLGVALLLITSAIPNALAAREERGFARGEFAGRVATDKPGPDTLLIAAVQADYRDKAVRGRLVQPEGPQAPVPPGLTALPKPGELAVSPALQDLMDSDDGELLRERLNGPVTAVIADEGLVGPNELAYYQGSDRLTGAKGDIFRINAFRGSSMMESLDSTLLLLILVAFVVMLIPVAVLIAAAVRFGGDRRDRRLAALRLVGSDGAMTRRIAAGEALAGALAGLVVGGGLFFLIRSMAGLITLEKISVFPSDLAPALWLVVLICVAVPASAILVTLLALRGVVIEPLGVMRTAKPVRRRIWWRLLMPVAGLGLLLPQMREGARGGDLSQPQVAAGVSLLLIGVTALLPWLVEAVVQRLGKGPVAWQLAVRRLQVNSGTAARTVNGIAVAVAGAIALQMMLGATSGRYTEDTGVDVSRTSMSVTVGANSPVAPQIDALKAKIAKIPGAHLALDIGDANLGDKAKSPEKIVTLTVGDCAALRQIAVLPSCRDGDAFLAKGADERLTPGQRYYLDPASVDPEGRGVPWTLPSSTTTVPTKGGPRGYQRSTVLVTPGAVPAAAKPVLSHSLYVKTDPSAPDAAEHVRNVALGADPLTQVWGMTETETNVRFEQIQRAVLAGATCVLLLIGASLLVSQLEQLRERRKLLAALVASGTPRATLGWSVLWQSALPVALGLLLAVVVGSGLGAVLLRMTGFSINFNWASVAAMSGLGAGVALLVAGLSMPVLWRLVRPDGLRTE